MTLTTNEAEAPKPAQAFARATSQSTLFPGSLALRHLAIMLPHSIIGFPILFALSVRGCSSRLTLAQPAKLKTLTGQADKLIRGGCQVCPPASFPVLCNSYHPRQCIGNYASVDVVSVLIILSCPILSSLSLSLSNNVVHERTQPRRQIALRGHRRCSLSARRKGHSKGRRRRLSRWWP